MPERPRRETEEALPEASVETPEAVESAVKDAVDELKGEEKNRAPETSGWIGSAKSFFAKAGKGLLKGLAYGLIMIPLSLLYITAKTIEKSAEWGLKKLGKKPKSEKKAG